MNKILLTTLLLCASLEAQSLTTEQELRLMNYSHTSSGKLRHQRILKRMTSITQEKAILQVEEMLKEEVLQSRLVHHNRRLFYRLRTVHYHIKVDALDGTIISQGRIE